MRPKEQKRGTKKGQNNKSSSVRSKVSEVKKGSRRMVARMARTAEGEEIRDLVTPTKATPVNKATPTKNKSSLAKSFSGKLQKAKSAVGLNGRHSRLQETPSSKSGRSPAKVKRLQSGQKSPQKSPSKAPDRRSTRRARALPASNGVDTVDNGIMDVDEQAKDAMEFHKSNNVANGGNASNPGFFTKLFRRGSYETLENGTNPNSANGASNSNNSSCVIS